MYEYVYAYKKELGYSPEEEYLPTMNKTLDSVSSNQTDKELCSPNLCLFLYTLHFQRHHHSTPQAPITHHGVHVYSEIEKVLSVCLLSFLIVSQTQRGQEP